MELLRLEKDAGIAIVTISRPKALNALNAQVFDELELCMVTLEDDPEVGGVIITGEGEKAFVAGADIKELAALNAFEAKAVSARGQHVFRMIEDFSKPVIAAVNGFALGGGCELALACHVRIASEKARMGLPEVSLGLIPGYGGTQRLPRLVGKGLAYELILTGDMIKADRALAIGLVNRVVAPEALLDEAKAMLNTILGRGPVAVRFALEAVNRGLEVSEIQGECIENNLFGLVAASEDATEGLNAFIERREASFKGQ